MPCHTAANISQSNHHTGSKPMDTRKMPSMDCQNVYWARFPPQSGNITLNMLQLVTGAHHSCLHSREVSWQDAQPLKRPWLNMQRKSQREGQTDSNFRADTQSPRQRRSGSNTTWFVNWSPYTCRKRHKSTNKNRHFRQNRIVGEWETLRTSNRWTFCQELIVGWWSIQDCTNFSKGDIVHPKACPYFVKHYPQCGERTWFGRRPVLSEQGLFTTFMWEV